MRIPVINVAGAAVVVISAPAKEIVTHGEVGLQVTQSNRDSAM